MHKVNVICDTGQEYFFDDADDEYEANNDKRKNVKVSDKLFDLMLNEGLIKKTEDGYVFVGEYEDALKMGKKKQ
jgi:hypothetical protein